MSDAWPIVLAAVLGPGAMVAVVALLRGYEWDFRLSLRRRASLWEWVHAEKRDWAALEALQADSGSVAPDSDETAATADPKPLGETDND